MLNVMVLYRLTGTTVDLMDRPPALPRREVLSSRGAGADFMHILFQIFLLKGLDLLFSLVPSSFLLQFLAVIFQAGYGRQIRTHIHNMLDNRSPSQPEI